MTPEEIKRAREICAMPRTGNTSFSHYWLNRRSTCRVWDKNNEESKHLVTWFQDEFFHDSHCKARTLLPKALDALENLKWEYENVCKFVTKFEEEVQRLKELLNTANKPKITLV